MLLDGILEAWRLIQAEKQRRIGEARAAAARRCAAAPVLHSSIREHTPVHVVAAAGSVPASPPPPPQKQSVPIALPAQGAVPMAPLLQQARALGAVPAEQRLLWRGVQPTHRLGARHSNDSAAAAAATCPVERSTTAEYQRQTVSDCAQHLHMALKKRDARHARVARDRAVAPHYSYMVFMQRKERYRRCQLELESTK